MFVRMKHLFNQLLNQKSFNYLADLLTTDYKKENQ